MIKFVIIILVAGSSSNDGIFTNPFGTDIPWRCDFGPTYELRQDCSFINAESGSHRFNPAVGTTKTRNTGPPPTESAQHGA